MPETARLLISAEWLAVVSHVLFVVSRMFDQP